MKFLVIRRRRTASLSSTWLHGPNATGPGHDGPSPRTPAPARRGQVGMLTQLVAFNGVEARVEPDGPVAAPSKQGS